MKRQGGQERRPEGAGTGQATAEADSSDEDYEMLAQQMIAHWTRIAQSHEITGSALIPLLQREAEWFYDHKYLACFDRTIDLIRQIRKLAADVEARRRGRDGDAA